MVKIKVLVKKEAQLLGFIQKAIVVEGDIFLFQHVNYNLAKLLSQYAYADDRRKFAIGLLDGKINHNVELDWWEEAREKLTQMKSKVEEYFNKELNRTIEIIRKAFLIKDFPREVELYLVYSLDPGSYFGSGSVYNGRAIGLLTINEQNINDLSYKFSIFLHELLHILLYYNRIYLDKDFEEALLDYFAPRGLLDAKLGYLSWDEVREKLSNLQLDARETREHLNYYENYSYFVEKLKVLQDYDFSENVWEYLLKRVEDEGIKRGCREILDKLKS